MIPPSTHRVPNNTSGYVNQRLEGESNERIARCVQAGPDAIQRRIIELDEEWDVERALEANAATAALVGLTLGATVDRKWFFFPAVVAGFLLQHAVLGWCPPLPIMRRLGFRTRHEIDQERYALKALRGDFHYLNSDPAQYDENVVTEAIRAART